MVQNWGRGTPKYNCQFTLLYSDFFITNVGLEAEIKTADETRTSDMP